MSEDQTPMIDILAFNCSNLHRDLWGAENEKLKEELLYNYLTNVDKEFSASIVDIKEGEFFSK